MTLAEYQARLEALEADLNRETCRQYAGLPYDEARMERLGAAIEALAREALDTIPAAAFPRPLFYATLRSSRASTYTRLENEIYRVRHEGVRVEVDGEAVHLGNWRLFNRRHARDGDLRRRVFDRLLDLAAALTPLLAERFALSRDLFAPHGLTPLDVYLEEESIASDRMARLIDDTARAAGPLFRGELERHAAELLGRSPDYHDDFYVFGSLIHAPIDPMLEGVDFQQPLGALYADLGFDLGTITIDGEPREGKHASPTCFGVRVPGEVYVLYQRTSPVTDYTGFCHEMGHALHFASVSAALPYHDRSGALIPAGVAETFSTLFERLGTEPAFLEELGLPQWAGDELRRRERFMDLFFLTFYGANAMFKLRYWSGPAEMEAGTRQVPGESMEAGAGIAPGESMDDADTLYATLYRNYVGFPMPGRYWQTHHVVSLFDVYAPSYLLAKIRAAELKRLLVDRFGPRWWRDPQAGAYLRDRLMGPGRRCPLSDFSTFDPTPYLESLGLTLSVG